MRTFHAEAAKVVDAPADRVFAILADYRDGHPHVLPREHFPELVVESGGVGAGTVLRVRTRAMGTEVAYRMVVTEPEPGRTLVEADEAAGVRTTFTVTPVDDHRRAHVRIATEWRPSAGLWGLVERLLNPPVARMIYRKELRLIDDYARTAASEPTPPPPVK